MAIELKFKMNDDIIGYWPAKYGQQTNNCIILAPGLPQYIDKYHPFIKTCEELSIDLFSIRYSGSRENDGVFNIKNSVQDIKNAISFIETGKGVSIYDKDDIQFKYKYIYLLGFSYGALPTLLIPHQKNIQKILICPFVNYEYHQPGGLGEILEKTFNFVNEAYGNTYNIIPKSLIQELQNINYNTSDKQSEYKIIIGKKDGSIPTKEIEWLKENYKIRCIIEDNIGHSLNISPHILYTLLN